MRPQRTAAGEFIMYVVAHASNTIVGTGRIGERIV